MLVGFYSHHIPVLCGIPPPLICLFTDGCARAGSLDLRAGCRRSISTHQIWVSSSPAQSLGQNFSSKQQQVVSVIQRGSIYHNYYQERIEKIQGEKSLDCIFLPKIKAALSSGFGLLSLCQPICFFPGGEGKVWPRWDVTGVYQDGVSGSPEEGTSRSRDTEQGRARWLPLEMEGEWGGPSTFPLSIRACQSASS